MEKKYYNMISGDYLLLGVEETEDDIQTKAFYKFENQAIKDLYLKILGIQDNEGKVIIGTFSNHFNYIVSMRILDLLFVETDIKQRGENI